MSEESIIIISSSASSIHICLCMYMSCAYPISASGFWLGTHRKTADLSNEMNCRKYSIKSEGAGAADWATRVTNDYDAQ